MSAINPAVRIQHYLENGAIRYNGNTDTACGEPWFRTTRAYDPKTKCENCMRRLYERRYPFAEGWTPAAHGNALTFNGAYR